jgi:hypothetical protein
MASQYGGIENDVPTIQLPDENDVADSESVNVAFRQLKDSVLLSLATASKQPVHHLTRIRSSNGTSIVCSFVPYYIQNIKAFAPYQYAFYIGGTDLTFTAADLDTSPPAFGNLKAYYLYLRWDGTAFKKHISEGIPDEMLALKKHDPNITRYLGAVFTNGSGVVNAIHKSGTLYTYDAMPTLSSIPGDGVPVTISLAGRIPEYCRKVRLWAEFHNTDPSNADALGISAPGGVERLYTVGKGDVWSTFSIDLPLLGTQIRARTLLSGGLGSATIRLEGMWES